MKEVHTPRSKDIAHRRPKECPSLKSFSDQPKKYYKTAKKSLNTEFASISDDFLTETVSESLNLSSISEDLCDNTLLGELESVESPISAEIQSTVTSEEAFTPISNITAVCDESVNRSLDRSKLFGSNRSVEVDVVVNLLKEARNQVFSSSDVSATSKKLLDVLVESSVRNLCDLPDEGDVIDKALSKRVGVVSVCLVIWLISAASMIIFRCFGTRGSTNYNPQPT